MTRNHHVTPHELDILRSLQGDYISPLQMLLVSAIPINGTDTPTGTMLNSGTLALMDSIHINGGLDMTPRPGYTFNDFEITMVNLAASLRGPNPPALRRWDELERLEKVVASSTDGNFFQRNTTSLEVVSMRLLFSGPWPGGINLTLPGNWRSQLNDGANLGIFVRMCTIAGITIPGGTITP